MCIAKVFRPTVGKAAVMLVFVLAVFIPSSISGFPNIQFDVIAQLQLILLLPWFALNLPALSYTGIAVWLVYIYVITCIYASAYTHIEGKFRKEFPHMNDRWKRRKKLRK